MTGTCECGCGQIAPIVRRSNQRKGHVKGQPLRFVAGHNSRLRKPLFDRFSISDSGCWIWTGPLNRKGYGRVQVRGVHRNAHRAVWLEFVGDLPNCMHLDHLCGDRRCVNPDHLEPVTAAENNRRKGLLAGAWLEVVGDSLAADAEVVDDPEQEVPR